MGENKTPAKAVKAADQRSKPVQDKAPIKAAEARAALKSASQQKQQVKAVQAADQLSKPTQDKAPIKAAGARAALKSASQQKHAPTPNEAASKLTANHRGADAVDRKAQAGHDKGATDHTGAAVVQHNTIHPNPESAQRGALDGQRGAVQKERAVQ